MKNYKRKLQLVAGSTYSLSLPKEWIKKFNLHPKQELNLLESREGILELSPNEFEFKEEMATIPVDKYSREIDQILMALYYYGFSKIKLSSNKEMSIEVKNKIRKTLSNLTGAEIIYEDRKDIEIKIIFDLENTNLYQLFFRINLIIAESIEILAGNFNWDDIKLNENDVDRLYHLSEKVINSSLTDRGILIKCGISNIKTIPSLFLISKKLENIADSIKKIAKYVEKDKIELKDTWDILDIIKGEINRSVLYLMGKRKKKFEKISSDVKMKIREKLENVNHKPVQVYVERIYRDLKDVEDGVVSVGFFDSLIND